MTRAIGLNIQTSYKTDADSILVGYVGPWDNRAATTRNGEARILPFRLNKLPFFKFVGHGATSSAAGGYVVRVAHMVRDAVVDSNTKWVTIGSLLFNGEGPVEFGMTGPEVERLVDVGTSPAITGDMRVTAVRLFPGSGDLSISNVALTSNVATVTVGTHTLQVGELVIVVCSNATFNGTYTITAVTGTTISYAKNTANVTSAAATGTVTNGVAVPAGAGNTVLIHSAR